jgi:hypothetical protein
MTAPDDEFTMLDERLGPDERDLEAPAADAVEQATPARPSELPSPPRTAFEADEYDAIEQSRVVEYDDEDY